MWGRQKDEDARPGRGVSLRPAKSRQVTREEEEEEEERLPSPKSTDESSPPPLSSSDREYYRHDLSEVSE